MFKFCNFWLNFCQRSSIFLFFSQILYRFHIFSNFQMPLPALPLNVWLKIFCYLNRNDIDNCEAVCSLWRQIVRRNAKFLPKRNIEFLVISSCRRFSITVCAEDKIKVFTFQKHFAREWVCFIFFLFYCQDFEKIVLFGQIYQFFTFQKNQKDKK